VPYTLCYVNLVRDVSNYFAPLKLL
jgi:hypothetical protein